MIGRVPYRRLPVNYAFHSAQMEPLADDLVARARRRRGPRGADSGLLHRQRRRLAAEQVDANFFGRNVRQPVRFAAAIDAMLADGFTGFLEIGAHPVLGSAIAECAAQRNGRRCNWHRCAAAGPSARAYC